MVVAYGVNARERMKSAEKRLTYESRDGLFSLGKAAVYMGGIVAVAMIVSGLWSSYNSRSKAKDVAAFVDNGCTWEEEVVADKDSNYRKWADSAIDDSRDMGARVGVDRFTDMTKAKNNFRKIVPGHEYAVPRCRD